ncbi:MAG: hypothetical protein PHD21_03495 [Flavobacteriales bacterium]|nr:hypothetical protein [Flavobacteriales bacterium]
MKNTVKIFLFVLVFVLLGCAGGKKEASIKDIVITKEDCSRPDCYPSIDTNVIKNVVFKRDGAIAYEYFKRENDSIMIEHNGCNSIIFKYVINTATKENEVNNSHLKHSLMVLKELSSADVSGAKIGVGADSLLSKFKLDSNDKKVLGLYSKYNVGDYKCQVILSQAIIENDTVKVWVTYSLEDK